MARDLSFVTRTPHLAEGGAAVLAGRLEGSSTSAIDDTALNAGKGPGDHIYVADADGRNGRILRDATGVPVWVLALAAGCAGAYRGSHRAPSRARAPGRPRRDARRPT